MSDALSALLHLSAHDYSWLAQFFSLLFLPFAHEDLAIILGAYVVVNDIMPVGLVALCIYGGMVASDIALYGIGASARRLPWLSRLAVDDRVRNFTDMLRRNLFEIVALCRVVPGVVFVAFVACGWRRVPLARFTRQPGGVRALSAAHALHRGLLRRHARWSCWLVDVAVPVLRVTGDRFRSSTGFQLPARAQAGRRHTADPRPATQGRQGGTEGSHPARPVLPALDRELDSLCIAIPVSETLPTVANPCHPMGGMWGESKSGYLLDVAANERRWIADFVMVTRSAGARTLFADLERVRHSLSGAGLAFLLIAKPDLGHNRLRRIDDALALREYLRHFHAGETIILQRFLPDSGEAAVLYARLPGAQSGGILSLTFRPHAHWRDASRHVTPELEARLDTIARSMREFHYGRFHLRFVSTDELMRGENFLVIEINGIRSGTSRDCDPPLPLAEVYRRLADQQRIMFLIGEKNRARGFAPVGCADALKSLIRQSQFGRRYPASA